MTDAPSPRCSSGTDKLRQALVSIAGWRSVNIAGEYEHGLRDIIRSMVDCAQAALDAPDVAQAGINPAPSAFDLAVMDERDQLRSLVERCAKIAEPWAGFWLDENSTDADRAVVAVRTEIAAKIRALSLSSQERL